jgi:Ricin-type beta-trefoil lectin domain-like
MITLTKEHTAMAAKDSNRAFSPMISTQRPVTIQHAVGPIFLDAHEIQELDFNVVTRPFQNNNTQNWVLTKMGGGLYTIMQVSSGRFLDAHEIESLDFRVVTRPRQNNNTQLWRLIDFGGAFFAIQQASSGRFLEAYITRTMGFQAVTRPEQPGNNAQLWRIVDAQ